MINLCLFVVYQLIILPFTYIKMVAHKFALMLKNPQGNRSSTASDRFGSAVVFILFGPLILFLDSVLDIMWFIIHTYKRDLDVVAK